MERRPSLQILRIDEVAQKASLSRKTIYRKMNAGQFPQSLVLGARSVGWFEHEVDAWLESLARNRVVSKK